MNLTVSVDDEDLRKVRRLARQRGTSVQQLIRDHLRSMVDDRPAQERAEELLQLMTRCGGHSGGRRIRRQEAYEGRS